MPNTNTPISQRKELKVAALHRGTFVKSAAKYEALVARSTPSCGQAKRLMKMFGGILPLCIACGTSFKTVLEWNTEGFGIVPMPYLYTLVKNARLFGVLLKPEHIFPDFVDYDRVRAGNLDGGDTAAWALTITNGVRRRDMAFQDEIVSLASTQAKRER
jgi:hypothetical protein